MSTTKSLETPATGEPSDNYASTPEISQPSSSKPAFQSNSTPGNTTEGTEDDETESLLNPDEYEGLTKPDTNFGTTFHPSDVREEYYESDHLYLDKEQYFTMLSGINRGRQNGPKYRHDEYETYELRRFLVEEFAGRLHMTDEQIRRSIARATNVDGSNFGEPLELLVFCACAYVVHQDDWKSAKDRDYHPNCKDNDERFEEVASEFNLRQDDIDRIYRRFEQEFTGTLPPVGYDERKPGWSPDW
jgi:hypothetical protein